LRKSGCDVVGVSEDNQEENDRFRKSLDLPFPLVGDPDAKITAAYKVRWPLFGRVQRVTYVIGRDKKVRVAFHSELSFAGHAAKACEVAAE
jgi:peroxiredoxin Q/BCP